VKDGKLQFDWNDEITRDTCVARPAETVAAAGVAGGKA